MSGQITSVLKIGNSIIDSIFGNKTEAAKHKARLAERAATGALDELGKRAEIIMAEANSGSWLARNWRPITMLTFTGLVCAHWLGFTPENLTPAETADLMDIIKIGLGGYVVGRSAEKVSKVLSTKGVI